MMALLAQAPDLAVTVDLERQTIVCGQHTYNFAIEPVRRMRLLNGWDDLALTESYRERVKAFKADDRSRRPWAVPRQVI
jgi:3-isopropylmalate/(R)-2-methylmalate dehydratase small subunit